MAYETITEGKTTRITDTASGFSVEVNEKKDMVIPVNTAYCQATLYRIKGGFIPEKVFVFRTDGSDLDALKKIVDFFFRSVLKTELYVKEVPMDSALFAREAQRLYGEKTVFEQWSS
jgi:hypothetical protein